MPLRDHFRPPLYPLHNWEGFHGGWPAMLVLRLMNQLPEGYIAEPRVHLGSYYEIDAGTMEIDSVEPSEYEVLIYEANLGRRLVAAIEIVSPANKDGPEQRLAFATKCAALIHNEVCVSIVDLVTVRHANLYFEMLELSRWSDPTLPKDPPGIYAVTSRKISLNAKARVENWFYPLELGRPLPTLPLWIADDLAIPVDLESCYEETCKVLRIA